MRKLTIAVLALVSAGALRAGEFSAVSPGLGINFSSATSKAFVPFQSDSGNIQGASAHQLYGIDILANVRLGQLFTAKLSSLVLVPTLGIRYGQEDETRNENNLNFFTSDGSVVSIQNAASTRKTSCVEVSFALPLRWYMGATADSGGVWIEAGPALINSQKTVNLSVSGLVSAVPTSIDESAKITATVRGFVAGVGWTTIYDSCQVSYNLTYMGTTGADKGVSNQIRISAAWTF